jgi:SAM-dependent methyltransferase
MPISEMESPPCRPSGLSLLDYYQRNGFNPVHIPVEDRQVWEEHLRKRVNLYQRHLNLPLLCVRGRRVIEFGCNSGENALVLALLGARLTLVEPNDQVVPRLTALFEKFGLSRQLDDVVVADIESYTAAGAGHHEQFDVVLAEGFLFTLAARDRLLRELGKLLAPGGVMVTSFLDRVGSLVEMVKRLVMYRCYELAGVEDDLGEQAESIARRLFGEDFERIPKSRSFRAWWKDTLVNPTVNTQTLWSYPEVLDAIAGTDLEFHSSSPQWAQVDAFRWYKSCESTPDRHRHLAVQYARQFAYLLTGRRDVARFEGDGEAAVRAACRFSDFISRYCVQREGSVAAATWPEEISAFLAAHGDTAHGDAGLAAFDRDAAALIASLRSDSLDAILASYRDAHAMRGCWGVPYHYLSFVRDVAAGRMLTHAA